MEEERLFMGEGLSFWAHRMRGLIFKCPLDCWEYGAF